MISNEVYNFISNFDKAKPPERSTLINANPMQVPCPWTFYTYGHVHVNTCWKCKTHSRYLAPLTLYTYMLTPGGSVKPTPGT